MRIGSIFAQIKEVKIVKTELKKTELKETVLNKKSLKHQNGFSLLEVLISLCITSLLMIMAINWLTFIQNNHLHQANHYAMERALFDQLEAYPEKLSLTELNLSQNLIDNWIEKLEINTTTVAEKCQKVTVSMTLKKTMLFSPTKNSFKQQRLFCGGLN